MSAWTIAKHVARGIPFSVRGDLVPVQSGPVLILNGDQSEVQVQQQMRDLEFRRTDPVTVVMGWDLNWYYRFTKLIQKHQPKLVIIDSITGCSRGSAFDENKKEFAGPIYWLSNNNGRLFPACTILLVHHANKTGGFRGSTAIRDAVDEVWGLRRPDKKQVEEVGSNARIITVEKSRAGRGDSTLLMKLESDLTFSLTDFVSEQPDSGPASVVDRVLQRLRAAYPRALSRSELAADALCGGSVAAIRKATQRLISRGLVRVAEERPNESGGTPIPAFQAITSCEKPQKQCPTAKETSGGLESTVGQPKNVSTTPLTGAPEARGEVDSQKGCPTANSSAGERSAPVGHALEVSPREARTEGELDRLMEEAAKMWD
jgi:hypothetical protein